MPACVAGGVDGAVEPPDARVVTGLPEGVTHWDGPGLDAWRAWEPHEAAAHLAGVEVPWCVVGGWAVDLFVGARTREHEDLEIAIPRPCFPTVRRALAGFVLHAVGDGEVRRLADDEEPPPERHQTWVLDPRAQEWRMDVMLEPGDAAVWECRRPGRIRASRTWMVGRSADGIPYLQPQGVLLYKAKAPRPKDEADLRTCLPRLDEEQRRWLGDALDLAHPGHPWTARVRAGG